MRALRWLVVVAGCCGTEAAAQTTLRVGLEGGRDLGPRRIATFGGEACPAIEPYLGSQPGHAPARILPVPSVKVALPVSRHFAVSRQRPDATALVRQLDVGLTKLREQGAILRVFERMVLFEPWVADWQVLGNN